MSLHAYVLKKCEICPSFDILVNNSLIEMYFKCGSTRLALQVFRRMNARDVNSWNAVIFGPRAWGSKRVFEHFNRMVDEDKLLPNSITFVGILSAGNHRGLVDEGQGYFDLMVEDYNVEPVLQHYGCLIDLLARKGNINEALDVVGSMKMKPDNVIWRSLVNASCKQGEGINLSQEIAKNLVEANSGAYVLLPRVFASANRLDEVGLIRKLMMEKGFAKEAGCSSVEIEGVVHEFFAGDSTHPQSEEIHHG